MNKKKLIGFIIGIIIILVIVIGSFAFVSHEKQIAVTDAQAQKAEQAKENNLKQEQLKAQEAKEKATDNSKTEQVAQTSKPKENTTQVTQTNQSKEKTVQTTQTKQNTQTENTTKTNTNNLSQEKAQLLNELSTLKPSISPDQHYGMLTQSELLYTTWDQELNKIWGVLENNLPSNKMEALRQNEREWINSKEQYMPAYNAAGSGNYSQAQSVEAGHALAQMTKDRCYYLVNNYM